MSKRILVVADQEDLRAILGDFLMACCTVIEAMDGAESVAKAASERPDLVLMDIQLPVLDGNDATRRIKALPGFAAIPIIAVSSLAMTGDEERRCDDCVTKPTSVRNQFPSHRIAGAARLAAIPMGASPIQGVQSLL
jgi:two-component system cell cycle response regulator DivK